MSTFRNLAFTLALVMLSVLTPTAWATLIYDNNFDSASFPNTGAGYTLDTANGVLNFVESAGANLTRPASVQLSDAALDSLSFTISSRFTINNKGAGGSGNSSIGFGAFGTTSTFPASAGNPNYLADWTILGTTAGALRILAQVDGTGFTNPSNPDTDGANPNGSSIVNGATYELRLTGAFTLGTLNMTLSVFDSLGVQIGASATAADTSPFVGDFFGLRNRVANGAANTSVSFDNFRVDVVPEARSMWMVISAAITASASAAWRSVATKRPGRSKPFIESMFRTV